MEDMGKRGNQETVESFWDKPRDREREREKARDE